MSQAESNEQRAHQIHQDAIVIDCLFTGREFPRDLSYLKMMHEKGGVDTIYASLESGQVYHNTFEVMDRIGSWCRGFKANSDFLIPVTSSNDIKEAKNENKLGVILGFQSTKPIQNNIDYVDIFYKLGMRVMQLTYQRKNLVGDGCGEQTDCGLSKFGVEVIRRMNELGMLIDLSHCGFRTAMEAIEISEKPCAFTHSNPRSLRDQVRNKTDEQIKALAQKGGVMSLVVFAPFLPNGVNSSLADLLDVIDYLRDLVGVDHIGLGNDFSPYESEEEFEIMRGYYPELHGDLDYDKQYPEELKDPRYLPELTRGLLDRGYSEENIKRILGGNNLRLFEEVWCT